MIVSRRSGKYKVYALSDDGLRYARIRRREKKHENEMSSAINEEYKNINISRLLERTISENPKLLDAIIENSMLENSILIEKISKELSEQQRRLANRYEFLDDNKNTDFEMFGSNDFKLEIEGERI